MNKYLQDYQQPPLDFPLKYNLDVDYNWLQMYQLMFYNLFDTKSPTTLHVSEEPTTFVYAINQYLQAIYRRKYNINKRYKVDFDWNLLTSNPFKINKSIEELPLHLDLIQGNMSRCVFSFKDLIKKELKFDLITLTYSKNFTKDLENILSILPNGKTLILELPFPIKHKYLIELLKASFKIQFIKPMINKFNNLRVYLICRDYQRTNFSGLKAIKNNKTSNKINDKFTELFIEDIKQNQLLILDKFLKKYPIKETKHMITNSMKYFMYINSPNRYSNYVIENLKTFVDEQTNILYIKSNDNINKIIAENITKYNLFQIYVNDKIKINKVPIYPLIHIDEDNYNINITPIQFIILNGFSSNHKLLDYFIQASIFYYGGFLINKIINRDISVDMNIVNDNLKKDLSGIRSLNNIVKVNPYINIPIKVTNHGWFHDNTKKNLEYVLKKFNPKSILELGTWFGLSDIFIKETKEDIILYTTDKFQYVTEAPDKYRKFDPLDDFYWNFPRLEVVYKNLSIFKKGITYLIKTNDAASIPKLLHNNKIELDVIFIDFEKNMKRLTDLLKDIFKLYPKITVVGDDAVFKPVQQAYHQFLNKNNHLYGHLNEHSYIISYHKLYE